MRMRLKGEVTKPCSDVSVDWLVLGKGQGQGREGQGWKGAVMWGMHPQNLYNFFSIKNLFTTSSNFFFKIPTIPQLNQAAIFQGGVTDWFFPSKSDFLVLGPEGRCWVGAWIFLQGILHVTDLLGSSDWVGGGFSPPWESDPQVTKPRYGLSGLNSFFLSKPGNNSRTLGWTPCPGILRDFRNWCNWWLLDKAGDITH